MGANNSQLFQRSAIVLPKNIKLKYTKFKKYDKMAYIYFTPSKKLNKDLIKIEIKRKEKPLDTFNVFIDKEQMKYNIVDNIDYLEYEHRLDKFNKDDKRKIIIRTNNTYHIQSIVLVVPTDYIYK